MPSTKRRQSEIETIERLMASIHQSITAVAPPELWLRIDISMVQLKALCVIHHLGEVRVGNVARAVGLSLNATTTVLDRLEQKRLVVRKPDDSDRRAVLVHVTKGGKELMQQLLVSSTQMLTPYLQLIGEEDIESLQRGLSALVVAIRDADAVAQPAGAHSQSGVRPYGRHRGMAGVS